MLEVIPLSNLSTGAVGLSPSIFILKLFPVFVFSEPAQQLTVLGVNKRSNENPEFCIMRGRSKYRFMRNDGFLEPIHPG
jgi:hypothetical protein